MGMPYSHSAFCSPLCIPDVDTASPTDSNDYATTIKSERLCERSRVLKESGAIPIWQCLGGKESLIRDNAAVGRNRQRDGESHPASDKIA